MNNRPRPFSDTSGPEPSFWQRFWDRLWQGPYCPKCNKRSNLQGYCTGGGCIDCFHADYNKIKAERDAAEREARIEEMAEAIRRAGCGPKWVPLKMWKPE